MKAVWPLSQALCAAFAVFGFVRPAFAQLELITFERPFHARNLSGLVVDPSGAPVPGVLVEECDASSSPLHVNVPAGEPAPVVMLWDCDHDPKHVIASAITDANGHFSFPQVKKAKAHYLHLRINGFDPMEIIVKLGLLARSELRIKMHVAT